jgi:hypothetical protein
MEKTGLTIGIVSAVNNIADGRIGLRTEGKTVVKDCGLGRISQTLESF